MIEPARDQIELFTAALFCRAGQVGFVSLRAFYEDDSKKPFRITPAAMRGGLPFLNDVAEDDARRAANAPRKVVFCPPIAIFASKERAREQDILEGLALSIECDQHPQKAKDRLENIVGPTTVTVRSGGKWIDSETGEVHDKLHLHWRLRTPARTSSELAKLKQARDIAARLVGGDPSNKPVCHPIRWPGSLHRKNEPRMCDIATIDAGVEIDLDTALTALTAAANDEGVLNSKANEKSRANGADSEPPAGWDDLIAGITRGENYHNAIARLAMMLLKSGMSDGAAVNMLRAWMGAAAGDRDERWQTRFDDIPRAVSTAREKIEDGGKKEREENPATDPPDLGEWDAGDDAEPPPPRGWLLGNIFG